MREFVFALTYEPGCNVVADALAAHPEASIRSVSCHATTESLWRVDHASGDADALAAIEAAVRDDDHRADCLTTGDCGAVPRTEVLDRDDGALEFYTRWERTDVCTSVPHLALEHVGVGVLFETRREDRRYTWRLILPADAALHAFTAALEEEVSDHVGLDVIRLTELDASDPEDRDRDRLPAEQREALAAAVARGYYETPREIELDELAAVLDVPRSTLSYRLRRAEAALAKSVVGEASPLGSGVGPA